MFLVTFVNSTLYFEEEIKAMAAYEELTTKMDETLNLEDDGKYIQYGVEAISKISGVNENSEEVKTFAKVLKTTGCILKLIGMCGEPTCLLVGSALMVGANTLEGQARNAEQEETLKQIQAQLDTMMDELKTIQTEIADVKKLAVMIYEELVDQEFQGNLTSIESTYGVFLRGAHNLELTMNDLSGYAMELSTKADHSLKPNTLEKYFKKVLKMKPKGELKRVFDYVIMVKCKYLLLVSIYYTYKQD